METEYEKQQRAGAEYIETRDRNIREQAKAKALSDAYLEKQEELKKQGEKADLSVPADKGRTEGYNHIVQSAVIFNNKTPEDQQTLITNERAAQTQDQLKKYGIGQDEPSKPGGYQTNVDNKRTTNPASELSQKAHDRRLGYQQQDEKFVGQIEAAKDDPLKVQRLKLERCVNRDQYEMETSHGAANVSRLLGDSKSSEKFSKLADQHEAKRDFALNKLDEFDKAHPEYRADQAKNQDKTAEQKPGVDLKQPNSQEKTMTEKAEPSENVKALHALQAEAGEKSTAKTLGPEQKELVKQTRESITIADQQREQDRGKQREQER